MNSVNLIGRVVRDPELKYVSGGQQAVVNFTLAVPKKKDKDQANFINCVIWGKLAEALANNVTKGGRISITGELETSSFDNKDGVKITKTEVIVSNMDFLSSKSNNGNYTENYGNSFEEDMTPVDDGDTPF